MFNESSEEPEKVALWIKAQIKQLLPDLNVTELDRFILEGEGEQGWLPMIKEGQRIDKQRIIKVLLDIVSNIYRLWSQALREVAKVLDEKAKKWEEYQQFLKEMGSEVLEDIKVSYAQILKENSKLKVHIFQHQQQIQRLKQQRKAIQEKQKHQTLEILNYEKMLQALKHRLQPYQVIYSGVPSPPSSFSPISPLRQQQSSHSHSHSQPQPHSQPQLQPQPEPQHQTHQPQQPSGGDFCCYSSEGNFSDHPSQRVNDFICGKCGESPPKTLVRDNGVLRQNNRVVRIRKGSQPCQINILLKDRFKQNSIISDQSDFRLDGSEEEEIDQGDGSNAQ